VNPSGYDCVQCGHGRYPVRFRFSRVVASGMPRRGSSMLGTLDAHHVEPMVFTLLGWGLLLFIAWVLFGGR
jgi:hypothetical protein